MKMEALLAEIEKRHQLSLEPNDPAFVLVTLNQLLLEDSQQQLQKQHEAHMDTLAKKQDETYQKLEKLQQTIQEQQFKALSQDTRNAVRHAIQEEAKKANAEVTFTVKWSTWLLACGASFVLGVALMATVLWPQ